VLKVMVRFASVPVVILLGVLAAAVKVAHASGRVAF